MSAQQPERAVQSPVELLRCLDRWLAASGSGADHPWRASIAATLAANNEARQPEGDAHCQPLRNADEPDTPAELLQQVARRVRRVRLVAEGAEALLDVLRGCEIDRDDMLELFGLIVEEAEAIDKALHADAARHEAARADGAQGARL